MGNLFSFTTAGATPKQGYLGGPTTSVSPLGYGTTPAAKALSSSAPSGQYVKPRPVEPPAPTTPVKKVNNVDGSSTEYHAPAKGMTVGEYQAAVAAKSQPSSSGMIQAGTNQPVNNNGSQPTSSPTPTYPGLISSITQNSLAGSPVAATAAQGLISNANSNPLEQGGAYKAYSDAVSNLNKLKSGIAGQYGGIESEAIPLEFQQGREQALSRQHASQIEAAQQAVTQAQAALGYGIQEQGQQQAGLTSAGNLGNTAQGQLQSGLIGAATLSQPQLGSYGQTYYSPTQGGQVTPQPQSYQIKPGDTFYALAAQYGTTPEAIEASNPGLDPNNLQPGQSIKIPATGGQFGNGPAAAANVQSVQDHTKVINDWSAARQSATNIGNQLTSFLQQNQINPTDFNAANKFLQYIGANTSSPQYKQFYNLVTDLANTYAPVLGQGDASNYKVQLAQSLLDGTANGKTIPQILQGLDSQAQAKIAGEQEIVGKLQSNQNPNPSIQTITATSTPVTSGAVVVPNVPGSFVQDASGKWIYQQ